MLHISLTRQELHRHIIIKILASALNRQFYKMIVICLGKRSTQKQKSPQLFYIVFFRYHFIKKKIVAAVQAQVEAVSSYTSA